MQKNPHSSDSSRLDRRVWSTSGIPFANILRQKACIVTVQGGKGRSLLGGLTFSDPECVLVYNLANDNKGMREDDRDEADDKKGEIEGETREDKNGQAKTSLCPSDTDFPLTPLAASRLGSRNTLRPLTLTVKGHCTH